MTQAAPRFDLACVGTSLRGLSAFTLEGLSHLAAADLVYYYPPTPDHLALMQEINDAVIDLNATLYVRGAAFSQTYDAIVAEVMNALRGGKSVAYAVQGSPAFHCGTARRLHQQATREGFSSILISGVSSFEVLSAELAGRYDLTSVQLYSIPTVVAGRVAIDARAPCLLFDLGTYALPAVRESADMLSRPHLARLVALLRARYSDHHPIFLLFVDARGFSRSLKTEPAGLEESLLRFGPGVTLFLPGRSA
jgi:hypothetical protein